MQPDSKAAEQSKTESAEGLRQDGLAIDCIFGVRIEGRPTSNADNLYLLMRPIPFAPMPAR